MELPHVGKQCSIATCNALDFLPFNCPFCHGIFCGSHGLPKDHDCSEMERANKQVARCDKCGNMIKVPDSESWTLDETVTRHIEAGCKKYVFVSSSSTSSIKQQDRACAFEGCRELQQKKTLTPVRCTGCQKNYCLKHRHAVDHGCSSLKTSEQIKEDRRRMAIEKLNKTFHSSNQQPKTSTTRKAIATKKSGGMVEWMKMKSKAKGPSSIPLASRLYLYVEFPKESRMEEQPMFFDKNYRVGKVLDMIVDTCRVQNNNNRLPNNDPQLLGLYKQPTLDSLDPAARLNDVLANMDTVYLERLGVIADL